ncbi:MAG: sugar kinase [Elusimicrobia bacterium RIFOXYB2_FULL_49_7]|nr:MAG: sugar kinase [Elusimicrobia bacterium RIFOXYB2_FULL_49_7]
MEPLWGIDLGGTKIEGVVLDSLEKEPILRTRIDTEAHKGYAHILDQIEKLCAILTDKTGCRPGKIGLGTPGTEDPKLGRMKNCNTTALNGMPLRKDLLARLKMDVRMANDANCFALAEALMGAGKGAETVFGVIMGTGVGGGVVIKGRILNGLQGIAGEWGHNELIPGGTDCYCGRKGCVETVISGKGLENYYESHAGTRLYLKEIVKQARLGTNPHAAATLKRLITYFGKAIANVINILDPHAIVLGGGVTNIEELYTDGVAEIRKHIFNNRVDTPILRHKLGDSAGVFGAAMLALDSPV